MIVRSRKATIFIPRLSIRKGEGEEGHFLVVEIALKWVLANFDLGSNSLREKSVGKLRAQSCELSVA